MFDSYISSRKIYIISLFGFLYLASFILNTLFFSFENIFFQTVGIDLLYFFVFVGLFFYLCYHQYSVITANKTNTSNYLIILSIIVSFVLQYLFVPINIFLPTFILIFLFILSISNYSFALFSKDKSKTLLLFIIFINTLILVLTKIYPLQILFLFATFGYAIGYFTYKMQFKLFFIEKIVLFLKNELEFRRQILHLLFGLLLIFLLDYEIITPILLLIVLIVGILLIIRAKNRHVPFLTRILHCLERDNVLTTFPGKGIYYYLLSSFIVYIVFPHNIAFAAIMILAIGDSLTNIIGRYFGKIYIPYNSKKTIEGPIVAFLMSSIAASIFVTPLSAIIASFFAMFVETLPLKIFGYEIDDNLTIPIVASIVLIMFQ